MKNSITQFSLVIIAFVALSLLMSYTRPAADEPKQYIVVYGEGNTPAKLKDSFTAQINQKLAEGWHLQGGVCYANNGVMFTQAMVK